MRSMRRYECVVGMAEDTIDKIKSVFVSARLRLLPFFNNGLNKLYTISAKNHLCALRCHQNETKRRVLVSFPHRLCVG